MIKQILAPFHFKKIPFQLDSSHGEKKRAANTSQTLQRLWQYVSLKKVTLSIVGIIVMTSSILSLLGPYIVGMAIDDFIVLKEASGFSTVLFQLVLVYTSYALFIFLQNFLMVDIAQSTVHHMRADLFKQFHALPISYFDTHQHGELMSRLTNDIDNVNTTLNQSVIQMFQSITTLLGTVIVMLLLSPLLTLITFTIIPLLWIGMRWITKRTGPLYKIQQNDLGEMNGFTEEAFSGLEVIKTFSQEQAMIDSFNETNKNLLQSSFWAQTYAGFIPKVMNLLNFLSFGMIALVGGLLAIKGYITVGVIVIFIEYARQFTRPLNDLANQFNTVLSAIAGAERVFQVFDEPSEAENERDHINITDTNGLVEVNHLSFSYGQTPILEDISFTARPGEFIAFIGHTGAGKTTLINILSRFIQYDAGSIQLDGIELSSITRQSLRANMSFVLQDSFLFQASILDNIRYGKLDATKEEVIEACKAANAHEFITHLPEGYDTILDETKITISQGQKQLLAIARAFIAKPKILILDEATSNIDTITEIAIQSALQRLMKGRTSFVIAHRLNTIQHADQIIMLQHGKIIEQGTHQELMQQKGLYYNNMQS